MPEFQIQACPLVPFAPLGRAAARAECDRVAAKLCGVGLSVLGAAIREGMRRPISAKGRGAFAKAGVFFLDQGNRSAPGYQDMGDRGPTSQPEASVDEATLLARMQAGD